MSLTTYFQVLSRRGNIEVVKDQVLHLVLPFSSYAFSRDSVSRDVVSLSFCFLISRIGLVIVPTTKGYCED